MRTSIVCLAGLCLVLPLCSAMPGAAVVVKKSAAQAASASTTSASSSEESIVKKVGGCGCGCGPCGCGGAVIAKKSSKSAKAASASSSSSSSSYESVAVANTCLPEAEIKVKYARVSGEALDVYYKRIISRSYSWTSTTETYVKTLYTVWKDFSDLDLWYDVKYLDFSKQFYSLYFAKKESETWEVYYSRIVKKEAWETDDLFARRIHVIRDCFPTLDLWTSQKWFDKYTRVLYATEFKRFKTESEEAYIKRIFTRDSYFDTTDEIWAKRVFLIQEATISSCNLWYSEKYLSYFSSFYKLYYKVQAKETAELWLTRVLTPLPNESLENALIRIKFIKSVTSDCGFWKLDYFKALKASKCLKSEWLVQVQKAFFPCGCGGAAVAISKSSSSSAAASSSSASQVSSSTTVVAA